MYEPIRSGFGRLFGQIRRLSGQESERALNTIEQDVPGGTDNGPVPNRAVDVSGAAPAAAQPPLARSAGLLAALVPFLYSAFAWRTETFSRAGGEPVAVMRM